MKTNVQAVELEFIPCDKHQDTPMAKMIVLPDGNVMFLCSLCIH